MVGDKDLSYKIFQFTPSGWRHPAAGVLVPGPGLGGPILIENIDSRIPPQFPILPLKLLLLGVRNEAWLEGIPPLGQTLEVVAMTMIEDLKGDGNPMEFNTKKGGGLEGEKREGCIQYPCTRWGGCSLQNRRIKTMAIRSGGSRVGRCPPNAPATRAGSCTPTCASKQHGHPRPKSLGSHPASPISSNINSSPYSGTPQLFFTCSATARASVSWSRNTTAWRVGLLSNGHITGSVSLGLGNAGLRHHHKGNRGVQRGPSTLLKQSPRHRVCAVRVVHTFVHCAQSYGIGLLLQQGMSASISHVAKRGCLREQEATWIEMDTYGDTH